MTFSAGQPVSWSVRSLWCWLTVTTVSIASIFMSAGNVEYSSKRCRRTIIRWCAFLCLLYQIALGPAHSQKMTSAHSSSFFDSAASWRASALQWSHLSSMPGSDARWSPMRLKNFMSCPATSSLIRFGAASSAGVFGGNARSSMPRMRSVARVMVCSAAAIPLRWRARS
jgi:hypothetical protein